MNSVNFYLAVENLIVVHVDSCDQMSLPIDTHLVVSGHIPVLA